MLITIKEIQAKFSLYAKTSKREGSLMCVLSRPGHAGSGGREFGSICSALFVYKLLQLASVEESLYRFNRKTQSNLGF